MNSSEIHKLLDRGVEEVIERDHLERELKSGKKLRVKLGIDPTKPDLHLGHAVLLRKMRQFQDLGHTAVLIIGDFTAMIGDPSGRSEMRPPLSESDVKDNSKEYLKQTLKVLNKKNLEIKRNGGWYRKEGVGGLFALASSATVQQAMRREDFKKRIKEDNDITVMELMYPLLQGYDSVKVGADVELGGTDQKFNLLMGRKIQRHYNMKEQDIITVPLIEGTDGARKMSKSYGNYIGLDEEQNEMFGKVMTIPDELIGKYFLLCTDVTEEEINKISEKIKNKEINPKEAKQRLAYEIVKIYHSEKAAEKAKEEFKRVFESRELPTDMDLFHAGEDKINIIDLLIKSKMASSKSDARRLIEQRAVKIDGAKVKNVEEEINLSKEKILQVGKHRFLRVVR